MYKMFIIDGSNHNNEKFPNVNEAELKTLYTDSFSNRDNSIKI